MPVSAFLLSRPDGGFSGIVGTPGGPGAPGTLGMLTALGVVRALLTLVVLAAFVALSGCRTVPEFVDIPTDRYPQLTSDDREFLERVDRLGGTGDVGTGEDSVGRAEVFLSFETWPDGRDVLGPFLDEAALFSGDVPAVLHRLRRLWGTTSSRAFETDEDVSVQPFQLVIQTDTSRFLSSIALNSDGWERIGWGVWRHPDFDITVTFHPGRIWEVHRNSEGPKASDSPSLPSLLRESLFRDSVLLQDSSAPPGGSTLGGAGIIFSPTMDGVPQELATEELRFAVFDTGGVVATLLFPDERRARIALVPLRLKASRLLGDYGFALHDNFAILRDGTVILISGISLTEETQ